MLTLNKIYKISFQCYKLSPLRRFATANASKPKPNYYKVLDIPEKATPAEIKAAFHKKAKEHHPDAQAGRTAASKESEEKFKLAVEAYKILSDESKRKDYDESIKPPKPSSSSPGATAWSEDASSESYSSSRTRYHNEKFYGDHTDYQQQNEGYTQYASPHPKQDPRQAKRVWAGMDYENILIGGLILALALRWTMFIWDTGDTRRVPYSEVEKLDPNDAEEEGVYIDVPKDQSRPLSIRDCQGLTMEQLDELDRMGYILPSSVKEEVMNYRETHKVYKKPKRATYWNYNNMYNEKMEPAPVVQGQAQRQQSQQEAQEAPVPKPVKKKPQKSLKEIADDVKKDVVQNTNAPVKEFRPEDYAVVEKKEEKAVPPGEVRIPRMRANMYNLEKNS